MSPRLLRDAYGKAAIRLVKVVREGARHRIHDCTVGVQLEGRFESAHTEGINAEVLPTDTMKNTVFALAKDSALDEPERFAHLLGRHFLEASAAADRVTIELLLHRWDRIGPHAFTRGSPERRVAVVSVTREGVAIEAGIEGLGLLRTAGSGFKDSPGTVLPRSRKPRTASSRPTCRRAGAIPGFRRPVTPPSPACGRRWWTALQRMRADRSSTPCMPWARRRSPPVPRSPRSI